MSTNQSIKNPNVSTLGAVNQTMIHKVRLSVSESKGIPRQNVPITQGVPLPKGALHNLDSVWVEAGDGHPVSAQFRTLSRWGDGSLEVGANRFLSRCTSRRGC